MSTATFPRVTLTVEVSSVLYDGILISALQASTTVDTIVASALRQIAFPRETPAKSNPSQLGGHSGLQAVAAPQTSSGATPALAGHSNRQAVGSLQAAILSRVDAAAAPDGVCDLSPIRREMVTGGYSKNSVSRGIRLLCHSGHIEAVQRSGDGFIVADRESQIRFVRRK